MLLEKSSGINILAKRTGKITPIVGLMFLGACTSMSSTHASMYGVDRSKPQIVKKNKSQNKPSLLTLGKSFAAQGEHAAAIPLFKSAYGGNALSGEPLLYLGKSLMAVGKYNEALEALQGAKGRSSHNQDVLLSLGQIYLILYSPTEAKDYFQGAINVRKQNKALTAKAYSGLGVSHELLGDHASAQQAFDSGLNIAPDNLDLLSNKALSLALNDKTEKAIEILLRVAIQPQAQSTHRQNLALAYAFHGDSVRSWQVASIDMAPKMAEQAVASFYNLKAMEQKNRMPSLVYGMAAPRGDVEQLANKVSLQVDGSEASKRIGGVEEKPEPKPDPKPEPVKPEMPPLMDPRGWAVQIGAYRKPEEIIKGWEILRERYFDIIGHLEPRRSEVNFGKRENGGPSGFYYRLNAGPLSGYRQSRDICSALISAGGDCWIRPPEPSEGKLPEKEN